MVSPKIPERLPGGFIHKPSAEAYDAYTHLARVVEHDSADAAIRVCAAAVAPRWRTQFATCYGVKESSGRRCIQRLLGKHCAASHWGRRCVCSPPADDHATLWMHAGTPALWVSQPYGLGPQALREIMAFCHEYDLECHIDTWPAWHFPGSTLAVIYSRPGVQEQLWEAARTTRQKGARPT
jgi:hypothetical protein